MELISDDLALYIEQHTSPESDLLKKLNRDTHAHVLMPRMLSGHIQGRALAMFSRMISPQRILEIGTYTGYSAICLSEGLTQQGKIITIDINEELETMVRRQFREAGIENKVDYRIGRAAELLPGIQEIFDLVFIDADKINYALYYSLIFDKVRQGGFIIADNVLWSGKVINQNERDKDLDAIRSFNKIVQEDERVENVILPVRDGLMIVRKR